MRYEDFKYLFEQEFFSMQDNYIIKWDVEKVILCNYTRDIHDELDSNYGGDLDIEYGLVRKDVHNNKVTININKNMIGETFFTSITKLVAKLVEDITPQQLEEDDTRRK